MATVRKRTYHEGTPNEKQVWIVDYFSPGKDGKPRRHIKTFERRRDAKDELAKINGEIEKGIHTPDRESVTAAEAGELWIAQAKIDELERSTVRQYRQHLDLHIKPFLGPIKLSKLTTKTVQEFRNKLIAEGRSHDMAKRVIVSLGSILGHAMESGLVARNVVAEQHKGVARRRRRVEGRQHKDLTEGVDYPTLAELRTLLTMRGRWRPFVITAIFTGLRASELRGLTWNDVELDRAVLHVRQRADRWNDIGAPKSDAGKRTVPLVPMVVNALREWRIACPHGELVFPTGRATIWSLPNLYRSLNPVQVELIGKAYGLHAFRHAAASLFIAEGFSPKRIQKLMGHSSIQVTFDTYGHLFAEPDEQDEFKRLQARLAG